MFGRYVRGPLLHLDADEARLEDHLPWVDLRDVQLRRRALAVEELEHVVGRAVGLREADVGVDVREREVRLVLREAVEGRALGDFCSSLV